MTFQSAFQSQYVRLKCINPRCRLYFLRHPNDYSHPDLCFFCQYDTPRPDRSELATPIVLPAPIEVIYLYRLPLQEAITRVF